VNDFELGVLDFIITTEIKIGLMQCPGFAELEQEETSWPSESGSCDSRPAPRRTGSRMSGNVTQKSSAGVLDSTSLDNQDRWQIVRDEVAFLTEAGVRDPDELARRVGFTGSDSMERFFYRYAIPIPYKTRQEFEPVAIDHSKRNTHLYEHLRNTPQQIVAATRTVVTHERTRPDAVPELLAMLGLPTEQQLTLS
jgi:hypothetical protein